MIKQFLKFILHVLVLIFALSAAATGFLYWIGYFENETSIAYLYDDAAFCLIEIDQLAALFAEDNTPFESAPIYGQAADRVADMIEKGANSIILNLSDAPSDELIALAAEADVTLFFIGALPTDAQIASYDKIWCFTESTAYAGELLGEQVALGFRDGTITDKNSDILLDYIFLTPDATYMETQDAIDSTLLELDHYGVYTTDVYAAAYSVAYSAAELAAAQAAAAALGEDGEEVSTEATETAEVTEGEEDAASDDAQEDAQTEETELSVTVSLSSLSSAEVILSIGYANATYLAQQADTLGWLDGYTPTAMACIVENYAAAQSLAETGLYHSIVYFDSESATETIAIMASNAWAQTPVTNGTDYAETDSHIFTLSHKVY